jgi:hypothetical protein
MNPLSGKSALHHFRGYLHNFMQGLHHFAGGLHDFQLALHVLPFSVIRITQPMYIKGKNSKKHVDEVSQLLYINNIIY